jgi:uncharacterized membrane protein
MSPILAFAWARLKEPSSWLGLAAFSAAAGTALVSAGLTKAGLIVGAVGAGFGGVGAFLTKEGPRPS